MNSKQLIIALALFLPGTIMAQKDASPKESPQDTKAAIETRVKAYDAALGLSEEQTARMIEELMHGEMQVRALREQCANIQEKMRATLEESNNRAERMLDERQQKELGELKKRGEFTTEVVSCGASKNNAKGGACCAAKAQVQAEERGRPLRQPTKSVHPERRNSRDPIAHEKRPSLLRAFFIHDPF